MNANNALESARLQKIADEKSGDPGYDAQTILYEAAELQAKFWEKLTELETATGMDIDSNRDFQGLTVGDLVESE
jgi:hypothetical protein